MTIQLIPNFDVLTKSTFSPVAIKQDEADEAWFFNSEYPKRLTFIRSMLTAYRNGEPSFFHDFDSNADATAAKLILERPTAQNGYGWTGQITGPSPTGKRLTISFV